jgi:uncharacterized protein (TIGR02996 family)
MSDARAALLFALHADPGDETTWLALADWFEETGQLDRADLIRYQRRLRDLPLGPERAGQEECLRLLLASGVRPLVPTLTNSIGMELALVPAGTFWRGSPEDEVGRWDDEGPRLQVLISRPFYLGVHTVTQDQYRTVTGSNPAFFSPTGLGAERVRGLDSDRLPVEQVSWHEAVDFCEALSELPAEQEARRTYRLPTEAEWEYACRAGTTTIFHFGDTLTSHQANFDGTRPYGDSPVGPNLQRPTPVGEYPPNAFGLCDMHGNVWEWCADWFETNYYSRSPTIDPRGPDGPEPSTSHVLRGGSWRNDGLYLRSAHRGWSTPDERIGFRVVLNHPCGVS